MKQTHIVRSLPLLASILGRKYGVQVRIGGDQAYTDGTIIQLPALPLDGGPTLLGLARGYCDHESAHIRHTDFDALKSARLTPLEQHIWNTIEDWRVERELARQYPGCGQNFQWLAKHLFLPDVERPDSQGEPALCILEWLLLSVRAWEVPELSDECLRLKRKMDSTFPKLADAIAAVLHELRQRCKSTGDAIDYARKIVGEIQTYLQKYKNPSPTNKECHAGTENNLCQPQSDSIPHALNSLQNLISSHDGALPQGVGERLRTALQSAGEEVGTQRVQVAVESQRELRRMSNADSAFARQTTTALRTRMLSLLQATREMRGAEGYSGRINHRRLYRMATGSAKIFQRKAKRAGINTSIHILLDASGSMQGAAMTMAGQACFAAASALHGAQGISLAVTAFPGGYMDGCRDTVAPILVSGQSLHQNFTIEANGGTPMAPAIWWALQQMVSSPCTRKIILIITDGEPDNLPTTKDALAMAHTLGVEVYALGIGSESVARLLPQGRYVVLEAISELAPALFNMLQKAMIHKQQTI